ncbi:MAG: sugar phosphate isomerase/epimerase [Acidobacteria bacterium]|nr:sugar phosphate isomerase/epimerase [Acidobacteriota bacterium]
MRVSFGSWAFLYGPYSSQPVPLDDVCSRLAEAGYDGVEICGFPPHLTLERYATASSRKHVQRLLDDLGLGISGYVPDLTMMNPTVEGNRKKYLDLLRRHVEVCADLGSPTLRVDTGAAPGSIPESEYADTADRLASLWRDAAEAAAEARVRMVWEFEPGFAFNKPSEVVDIFEQVGHPNFQVLFDTCHAYLCGVVGARQQGDPETLAGGVGQFLDLLSGRIGHIHIVDTDGTLYGEETSRHCPFGMGVIDFPALAEKLKAVPGVNWWCVDLSFWPGSWDLLEPSLNYVRRLLG